MVKKISAYETSDGNYDIGIVYNRYLRLKLRTRGLRESGGLQANAIYQTL